MAYCIIFADADTRVLSVDNTAIDPDTFVYGTWEEVHEAIEQYREGTLEACDEILQAKSFDEYVGE